MLPMTLIIPMATTVTSRPYLTTSTVMPAMTTSWNAAAIYAIPS
jgi:hypothetical protein